MRNATLLFLALSAGAGSLHAQGITEVEVLKQVQNPAAEAQEVRLAAARFIRQFLDGGEWFAKDYRERSPQVLAPWTLAKAIHDEDVLVMTQTPGSPLRQTRVISKPLPLRSVAETQSLAEVLKARVGTSADSIYCEAGACHGVLGLLVQIGNPVITGDQAVIVFGLLSRTQSEANRMGLPGRLNTFALYLDKGEKGWTGRSAAIANQDQVGPRWKPGDPAPSTVRKSPG